MIETKKPKWDSGVAVSKGKQSISLFETYKDNLFPRIPVEEHNQHAANVSELEKRLSGQGTNLSEQKSSTSAQDDAIKKINQRVVSIRSIVMNTNSNLELKKAFGVGNKLVLTVNGMAGAVDTIVTAYKQNTVWSNNAGIIEKDIEELTSYVNLLFSADGQQEKNKYVRKSGTMDKNTLQRLVENGVSKISALGVHEFELSNPSVAKLFADLIPGSPSKSKKVADKTKAQA